MGRRMISSERIALFEMLFHIQKRKKIAPVCAYPQAASVLRPFINNVLPFIDNLTDTNSLMRSTGKEPSQVSFWAPCC